MTSPDPTAGTVLGEEARRVARDSFSTMLYDEDSSEYEALDAALDALDPIVRSLLFAAREAGREEGRRECGAELRKYSNAIGRSNIYDDGQLAQIENGLNNLATAWSPDA